MQNLLTLVALGFAAARGTQLVVHDTIGDPLRARLLTWHMNGIGPGRTNRLRSFFRDLLSCVYCVGWWLSVFAVAAYITAAGEWHRFNLLSFGLDVFAVAGVQMIINRVDDTLPVR